ncbi:MAG: hypothetical protein IPK93_10340 [Solirubrobacterales bacterium]|nr:hypothetical protein [Solirubrobacterales bacterium]
MSNELLIDVPRLGWLIDGDEATPHVAVMLQDTGRQIVLTVPNRGLEPGDTYAEWFFESMGFETDKPAREAPRNLVFHDNNGPVALVGCRTVGGSFQLPGPGAGKIVPNFAVIGSSSLNLERVHGIRTELPGLTVWSGISSISTEVTRGQETTVNIVAEAPEEIRLDQRNNLTLRPDFRVPPPRQDGSVKADNIVQLVTSKKTPSGWSDLLESHLAIRELLVVSAWEQFGFSKLSVSRLDDSEMTMAGDEVGPTWREVRTHRLRQHKDWSTRPRFLFTLSDIGTQGVAKWITLRRRFGRAVSALVSVSDQQDAFWETRLMLTGVALEALGYQLALDAGGKDLNDRKQLPFPKALELVLEELPLLPFPDADAWVERAKRCNSGIKHPDNPMPDSLEVANTQRENLLVLRLWIAGRLGCPKGVLEQRLPIDPLFSEYMNAE